MDALMLSYWPVLVIVLMLVAAVLLSRMLAGRARLPYVRRKTLVTATELTFFRRLREAINDQWQPFAMVRIADLIRVEPGNSNHRQWLNKILSKHIDFVLCDPETLEVVLAIELDDPSHDRPDRQARDEFVNHAFEDAALALLRIKTQRDYNPTKLRQLIDQALGS